MEAESESESQFEPMELGAIAGSHLINLCARSSDPANHEAALTTEPNDR